ncbi:MAG TPA: hypothetical protein VL475_11615, partial [Planctomycetaceae bacterium]|nr:hypothetical protein [Planctomycetaceae bacterium]
MTGSIEVLTGEAGSGKTTRLLEIYCQALAQAQTAGRLGTTLWLVPTSRARTPLLERLIACQKRGQTLSESRDSPSKIDVSRGSAPYFDTLLRTVLQPFQKALQHLFVA